MRQARLVVGPRVPGVPQTVATGRHWPRSTLCRVLLPEPHADDAPEGVRRKRWKSYIDGVAVLTFTRRPWLFAQKRAGKAVASHLGDAIHLQVRGEFGDPQVPQQDVRETHQPADREDRTDYGARNVPCRRGPQWSISSWWPPWRQRWRLIARRFKSEVQQGSIDGMAE